MLQQVIDYAQKEIGVSEPGFTTRNVRWRIELADDGRFLGALPQGQDGAGVRRRGCPDTPGMNSGGKAHFLVEAAQNALLLPTKGEPIKDSVKARFQAFQALVKQANEELDLPQLSGLASFLGSEAHREEACATLIQDKAKPTDWVEFRVSGWPLLEQTAAIDWWRRRFTSEKQPVGKRPSKLMVCVLSGEETAPELTHPKIAGLPGGLSAGDAFSSFDKNAFGSFGLEKSANAAMSAQIANAYTAGINELIKQRSVLLAGSRVLYWFKETGAVSEADDPWAWMEGTSSETQIELSALAQARNLLKAIETGARPDLAANQYHALTLSGASGRVMVRAFMEGSFPELVSMVAQWFDDLRVVANDGLGESRTPKLFALAASLVFEPKNLTPGVAIALWHCGLRGAPVPGTLLAAALARFRADLIADNPFNTARMGLIKAYFLRRHQGVIPMEPYLNEQHPEPAYQCGRLIAVLAALQKAAIPEVNAGLVQRYYTAVSQTPALVLGRLIANSQNHLAKLDAGLAYWFEQRIAAIASSLGDRLPKTLTQEQQGLFALGYYQQIAANRAGKSASVMTKTTETAANEGATQS